MTKTNTPAEGVSLVYQCKLRLSTSTIEYLAGLLRSRLKAIRSPFRSLPPGRIAVLVLAMLRHDQRLLDLAGGSGVPESTLRRWRDEMIGLLAARAPRLDRALRQIAWRGGEVVLLDGALIPTLRRTGADNRPKLTPGQKQANQILAAGRARVKHGFANLKAWRVLTKLRTDPGRATALLRALLVLTNLEVNR